MTWSQIWMEACDVPFGKQWKGLMIYTNWPLKGTCTVLCWRSNATGISGRSRLQFQATSEMMPRDVGALESRYVML